MGIWHGLKLNLATLRWIDVISVSILAIVPDANSSSYYSMPFLSDLTNYVIPIVKYTQVFLTHILD